MLPLECTHPAGRFGPVLRRSGERRRLNIRPEQVQNVASSDKPAGLHRRPLTRAASFLRAKAWPSRCRNMRNRCRQENGKGDPEKGQHRCRARRPPGDKSLSRAVHLPRPLGSASLAGARRARACRDTGGPNRPRHHGASHPGRLRSSPAPPSDVFCRHAEDGDVRNGQ